MVTKSGANFFVLSGIFLLHGQCSGENVLDTYGEGGGAEGRGGGAGGGDGDSVQEDINELDALQESIPGVPGEDYPIYAEVPESEFSCDGLVN